MRMPPIPSNARGRTSDIHYFRASIGCRGRVAGFDTRGFRRVFWPTPRRRLPHTMPQYSILATSATAAIARYDAI